MKNIIFLFLILFSFNSTFSQDKIKGDLKIMSFLGTNPSLSESNALSDGIYMMLYHSTHWKNNARVGYLSSKGDTIVPAKYHVGSDFYGDYANVVIDSIFGYIDKTGQETFFPQYDKVFFYYSNTGIAKKDKKFGLINRKGEPLSEFKYRNINLFGSKYFKCQTMDKVHQVLDEDGQIIFNKELAVDVRSHYFNSDSILIYMDTINGSTLKGLINIKGIRLTKPKYMEVYPTDDSYYVVIENGRYGFIDKTGLEVIPSIYRKVGFNIKEELVAVKQEGKWGFINLKNETIIPFEYDKAFAFIDNLAFVQKGEFFGCINKENETIIDFTLTETKFPYFSEDFAILEKSGKFGYFNKEGKTIIPAIYDYAFPFFKGRAVVELDGKMGVINKKGEPVIPIIYLQLWFESERMIRYAE